MKYVGLKSKKKVVKKKAVKKKIISPQERFDKALNEVIKLTEKNKLDWERITEYKNGKLMKICFEKKENIDISKLENFNIDYNIS